MLKMMMTRTIKIIPEKVNTLNSRKNKAFDHIHQILIIE